MTARQRVLAWIAEHDDSWLFIVFYVGLGLVLSMTISLFWLVAVVAAHAVLEWFAMGRQGILDHRAGRVLWHLKLDIGLVLVALWLGLYLELLFGLAGLGAAARAGAQTAARAVAWQRSIRGVLMTVDEAAHVVKAVAARNGPRREQVAEVVDERPPWRRPWSRGDKFAVVFTLTWAALILLAPVLTHHTVGSTLAILAADLHPWPPS
ncbi:MAG: hypothetical protein ACNA8G_01080 [Gammaproteobacteria bacterium]